LTVFCGIDCAEAHHDVALVDADGQLVAKRRIIDDADGFALLLHLFADAGDSAESPIPLAIETGRGLLVASLRATGRKVYAIKPMAVSRYRDRHSVAGKKSDAGRRAGARTYPAHRRGRTPAAADRFRTGAGDRRPRARPARRRLGTHLRPQ
jgi:hypothetical protein